jgi:transposase-like protein
LCKFIERDEKAVYPPPKINLKEEYTLQVKPLSELKVSELWEEIKVTEEEIWGDLKMEAQVFLKRVLEGAMEDEVMDYVGISRRYQRCEQRATQRNGYYERDLETELGLVRELEVPRTRDGGYRPKVFKRYQRRREAVNDSIKDIFLAGVSTRRVGEVLKPLIGANPSSSTVSQVVKSLDTEVRRFHHRVLWDRYRYLFLDGLTVRLKTALGVRKRLLLVAYGIRKDGRKELIAFRQARSESEEEWESLLNDLYRRGLEGESLELIITDGAPGLHAAIDMVYPYTPRQRCWVHKLRNVAVKLSRNIQKECLGGAKLIYLAANRKEAIQRYWEWTNCWRDSQPKAVACLEKDLDELLNFFAFPEKHRSKIRTTNAIERSFREIRRRIRPMSCFTNEKSCERIIYALFHYNNKKWENAPIPYFTQHS